jgi:hypothetical protein
MMHRLVVLTLSSALVLQSVSLLAAQAPAAPGSITGTARSSNGQTLPNYTVRLRNLQTGELASTTTSNVVGSFSFTGLSPASYVVEVVNASGAIIGSSAPIVVTAGAAASITVTATAAAAAATGGGISTALIVTTAAIAAGVTGVVIAVSRDDASPNN